MSRVNINPPELSDNQIQYFLSKIDKTPGQGPKGDCWGWSGNTQHFGYGRMLFRNKGKARTIKAHRLSYFLHKGTWPSLDMLHDCDNPPCTNPNHLSPGTPADNVADMVKKGRQAKGQFMPLEKKARGERNGYSTLTEALARQIKVMQLTGAPRKEIVRTLGLGKSVVSHVMKGRTWKHISP